MNTIRVVQGDITTLEVDAIVNAANERMLGGGGVDGAIHWAAGDELFQACLKVPEVRPDVRCPTGEARITPGFRLPARFVIHTVGPVYRDGRHREPESLATCYRNSLALATENGCRSIAFPCISTGIFGYPIEDAAKTAVREVRAFLESHPELEIIFCCFSGRDKKVYDAILAERTSTKRGLKVHIQKLALIWSIVRRAKKCVQSLRHLMIVVKTYASVGSDPMDAAYDMKKIIAVTKPFDNIAEYVTGYSYGDGGHEIVIKGITT